MIFEKTFRLVREAYTTLLYLPTHRTLSEIRQLIQTKDDRADALLDPVASPISYTPKHKRQDYIARYQFAAKHLSRDDPRKHLDIACGMGYGAAVLDTLLSARSIIGGDISRVSLSYASRHYPEADYAQVSASEIPFPDETFGSVTSIETVEHVPDYETFLRELRRVTSQGGTIFLTVPNDEDISLEVQENKEYPHIHSFSFESLSSDLSKIFPDASISYYRQDFGPESFNPTENGVGARIDEESPYGFYPVEEAADAEGSSVIVAIVFL